MPAPFILTTTRVNSWGYVVQGITRGMPRQSRRSLPRRRLRTRHHERCRDKHVAHPQTEAVGHTSFYVNHSIGVMNLSGSSHDTRPCGANTNLLCLDIFMPRCSLECVHHSKSLSVWSHSSVRRSWRCTLPFHKLCEIFLLRFESMRLFPTHPF